MAEDHVTLHRRSHCFIAKFPAPTPAIPALSPIPSPSRPVTLGSLVVSLGCGATRSASAIRYRSDGAVDLRLRWPRRKKMKNETDPAPDPEETGTGEPVGEASASALRDRSFPVLGILHYFWEEARLTFWHPGLAGTRSWSSVRCRRSRRRPTPGARRQVSASSAMR